MRKITAIFNKPQDIRNIKKIMSDVHANNSDHLKGIAKFNLGKIFAPKQVEKAELHIETSSGTAILPFHKESLTFLIGEESPFDKVAVTSEDEAKYIVLPWNLTTRVGRDNLKNLIDRIRNNVKTLTYIIYVNRQNNSLNDSTSNLASTKDLSGSMTSLASLNLSDTVAEDETEVLLNKIDDLEQRLTAQTWTLECPINVIGRGDGSKNILNMSGCTLTLAGNSITATNLKSYVSIGNVAGNVILDIVNKKMTIGGSRCGPIDIH